jgi:hypothetical protein
MEAHSMKGSQGEKITIWWSAKHGDTRTSTEERVRVFSSSNWLYYLIMLTILIASVLLAIFLLAAFLALFVLAAISLGSCFWWLRWKLHRTPGAQTLEGDVIEATDNVERKAGDMNKQ